MSRYQETGVRYGRLHDGSSVVWLTPPAIIDALGPFDLDPCAAVDQPWRTATTQFTSAEDGLSQPWSGFVWCNPPYGRGIEDWLQRLVDHGTGLALIPARTEPAGFNALFGRTRNVCCSWPVVRGFAGRMGPEQTIRFRCRSVLWRMAMKQFAACSPARFPDALCRPCARHEPPPPSSGAAELLWPRQRITR